MCGKEKMFSLFLIKPYYVHLKSGLGRTYRKFLKIVDKIRNILESFIKKSVLFGDHTALFGDLKPSQKPRYSKSA